MTFETIMLIFLGTKSLAIFLCFCRVLMGPTMMDRVLALDTIGLLLIGFVGNIMISHQTTAYTEIILIIAILASVSSIVIAKFLERGAIFER